MIGNQDESIYEAYIGTDKDLNHILQSFEDSEDEIATFCDSRYICLSNIKSIFRKNPNDFLIMSLNVQSIHAKFSNIFPIISSLSASGLYFGAICLQETWLADDADLSLLQLPGYKIIHQGKKCTRSGGLIIYLNEKFSFKNRKLYDKSTIWEGQFIEVNGHNLRRPMVIGNIYRPPHHNNNNDSIDNFITELSPILDILQKENTYTALAGDFNINLLQINERDKYGEFLDLMCTNSFFPKISMPTRCAGRSCTLIDNVFCKVPHKENLKSSISSAVLLSRISDHFPCVINFQNTGSKPRRPKYITKRSMSENNMLAFRNELNEINISSYLHADLDTNPNIDYDKFENIITTQFEKHFPEKRIKFDKYKHKLSPWITTDILKSIEFRDNLYKSVHKCSVDNPEYDTLNHNLKMYNSMLNRNIKKAKQTYYHQEFAKYKDDIRKTWDTLKVIINKTKSKSDSPAYLLDNGNRIMGSMNIANKFNEFFTQIGPQLASSIDDKNKPPFNSFLKSHSCVFRFEYTEPSDISKIINKLKPKTSSGPDNISPQLAKNINDIIAHPLSIIINQSLCTGQFPDKLKVAKVLPLLKKKTINYSETIAQSPFFQHFQKYLKELLSINYITISLKITFCTTVNMVLEKSTPRNSQHSSLLTA